MKKFWDKVIKCKHKRLSNTYYKLINCETPYCSGSETRCLDCGIFISTCKCSFNNGMSGWSKARWKTYYKNKKKSQGNK